MSDTETTPEIDILVDIDLSKIKNKLKRKIVKNIKKGKLSVAINVDIYDVSPEIEVYTDAIATLKSKKRKKNKKK
jgi:hypothetical protein